jgi:hypothetical protein
VNEPPLLSFPAPVPPPTQSGTHLCTRQLVWCRRSGRGLDEAKSAFLASHFRGPALDWLANQILSVTPSPLANFSAFQASVRNAFGVSADRQQVLAQERLGAFKQKGDLLVFLAEFEGLCTQAGLNSDISRMTLLMPKLEPFYANALRTSGQLLATYTQIKACLGNLYVRQPAQAGPAEAVRKRGKCGKCGKKGHTALQCRSGN